MICDRQKGKIMTLDEAIGDMRAAHEADMDLVINFDDLKDVVGYLEELKQYLREPQEVIVKGNLCWCPNCKAKLRYRNSNGCRRNNLGKYCEHCGARIEYPERM